MSESNSSNEGGGWSQPASFDPGEGRFTETTTTSWWERIKGAFAGILPGLLLIPASAVLLFWNEGRAVQTARSLAEGAGLVAAAPAERVDPALEGRLIHLTAPLRVTQPLRDAEFGVVAQGAVRLVRSVEMYQWKEEQRSETRSRLGGGQETVTTYSYTRAWSAEAIDSSRFRQGEGRTNPAMRFQARETVGADARLGAFALMDAQLRGFGEARPLPVEQTTFAGARVVDGALYLGQDPASPRIGDMRIRFAQVPAQEASLIARPAGTGVAPYQTRAGDALFLLRAGNQTAPQMIQAAEAENRLLTWILRAVGAVLMFIGFSLILRPQVVLADVVPLFGSIIGFGTGLIAGMLTFLGAPLVIAVAWFWYRPLVAAVVLAIGLAGAFGMTRWMRARRASATPRPA
jgi:hypothetical protein